jgi:hypothetical protein
MSNDKVLSTGRRMILLSAASTIAVAVAVVATSRNTASQEVKKPTISSSEVRGIVNSIAQGIYKVAPKYDVHLPEDYLKIVPDEIFPSAISIVERRFTVVDK